MITVLGTTNSGKGDLKMSRRGNGEGSIHRRRDRRWEGRYAVHTAEGRKQKTVYGKTRKEVSEKLTSESR
jgi:hypothetical protein